MSTLTPVAQGEAVAPGDRDVAVDPVLVKLVWTVVILGSAGAALLYGLLGPRTATFGTSPFGHAPTRTLQTMLSLATASLAAGVVTLALPLRWRAPRAGRAAAIGLAGLGTSVVLSAWSAGVHATVGLFALPLLAVGGLVFPRASFADVERLLRWSLRTFVWGSLLAGVVAPAWAAGPLEASFGFGFASRLAGIAPHPNALGPLAVALAVLEWSRRPRTMAPFGAGLAVVALAWTHSRTSWIALAAIVLIDLVRRRRHLAPEPTVLAGVLLAAVVGATAVIGFGLAGAGRATAKGEDTVDTFTGRTAIWEVTIEVWQSSPILGVGPRLWDDAMDRTYAARVGFPPGHAHNQLIHTLGEAGVVGVAFLLVALIGLAKLAGHADARTSGASTGLFVLLVITSFSEPPIRSVPFSTNYFLLAGTLVLLLAAAAEAGDG